MDTRALLAKVDLVDIVQEVVQLTRRPGAGGKEMLGLCPFHNDSRPSFEVNGDKQVYSCWGCSAGMRGDRGGDALSFVQRYYDLSFFDAVKWLAIRAGVSLPGQPFLAPKAGTSAGYRPPQSSPRPAPAPPKGTEGPNLEADRAVVLKAIKDACEIYARALDNSEDAKSYLLEKRKLSHKALSRFHVGYAPDARDTLRSAFPDYASNATLVDAGLVRVRLKNGVELDSSAAPTPEQLLRYDFFRDRVLFGVRNADGDLVALGGRRLSDEPREAAGKSTLPPKYLNSPETAVFSKSDCVFGLFEGKQAITMSGFALVVEGYIDVVGLASVDIDNAVSCMGTAITAGHLQQLFSHTSNIVFCLDGDTAGWKGMERTLPTLLPLLEPGRNVSFLVLPDELDPDEFVRERGARDFNRLVSAAMDLPQFWRKTLARLIETELGNSDRSGTFHSRADLKRKCLEWAELIPGNQPLRQVMSNLVVDAFRTEQETPKKQWERRKPPGQPKGTSTPPSTADTSQTTQLPAARVLDRLRLAKAVSGTPAPNDANSRLAVAVSRMPDDAAAMRPTLIRQQQCLDPELMPAVAAWQMRYDQALALGYSTRGPVPEGAASTYRAIVAAAPSIFKQFIDSVIRDREQSKAAPRPAAR